MSLQRQPLCCHHLRHYDPCHCSLYHPDGQSNHVQEDQRNWCVKNNWCKKERYQKYFLRGDGRHNHHQQHYLLCRHPFSSTILPVPLWHWHIGLQHLQYQCICLYRRYCLYLSYRHHLSDDSCLSVAEKNADCNHQEVRYLI